MDKSSPYHIAHLVTASARLLDHKKGTPPTVKEIAEDLSFSPEQTQDMVNRLAKMGVLKIVQSASTDRIFVGDPALMEELPKEKQGPGMEQEIEKFAAKRKAELERIQKIAGSEKERKKQLFEALNEQLKKTVKEKED
jgi:DNA-binding Lrp family transcriptional regulator